MEEKNQKRTFVLWLLMFIGFQPPLDQDGKVDYQRFRRHGPRAFRPMLFNYILILLFLLCAWTTWYTVDKDENATIRLLGAHVDTVGPGIHVKLPWPVMVADETSVTKVHRMEIGFRTVKTGPPAKYDSVPEESIMLTGDENIVDLDFIIQYVIEDAGKWQFTVQDPEKLLNFLAQASMRQIIGKSTFDMAATSGKANIQDGVKTLLQRLCKSIDFGVKINAVQLQDVDPPAEVMDAFKDVVSAREDRSRVIHEATAYRNDIIPKARGEAAALVNDAEGDAEDRIKVAEGEAGRFLALWAEYKKNKDITRERLLLEALQRILAGKEVVVDLHSGTLRHMEVTGRTVTTKGQ